MAYYKLFCNEKEAKANYDKITGLRTEEAFKVTLDKLAKNVIFYLLANGVPEDIVPIVLANARTLEPTKVGRDIFRKKRNNSSCIICGTESNLTIHHLKPVNKYPELKYNPNNLKVICSECHKELHESYKVNEGFTV